MAQTAATTTTGTAMSPAILGNPTTTPVVIDIRDIMDHTRMSSLAITQIVENHTRMVSLTDVTIDVEFFNHLHAATTSSLHKLQTNLNTLSVLRIFVHSVSGHFSCQKLCNSIFFCEITTYTSRLLSFDNFFTTWC